MTFILTFLLLTNFIIGLLMTIFLISLASSFLVLEHLLIIDGNIIFFGVLLVDVYNFSCENILFKYFSFSSFNFFWFNFLYFKLD